MNNNGSPMQQIKRLTDEFARTEDAEDDHFSKKKHKSQWTVIKSRVLSEPELVEEEKDLQDLEAAFEGTLEANSLKLRRLRRTDSVFGNIGTIGTTWRQTKKLKGALTTEEAKAARHETGLPKKHVRFKDNSTSNWMNLSIGVLTPLHNKDHKLYLDRWELVMLIALTYETWAFPFRLAIGNPSFSGINLRLLMCDVSMDLLFLVEAILILNTVVVIASASGKEKDNITLSRRADIAKYYFQSTFPHTLLPCLGMYVVCFIFAKDGHDLGPWDVRLWVWWISTLPRLVLRGRRLVGYYKKMELELEVNIYRLQLFKFACVIFQACHWVGCLFYFESRLAQFHTDTWVYRYQFILQDFDLNSSTQGEHYIVMLYKGFNMVSNMGYERIAPSNKWEVLWSIVVMFLQVGLSAYILGTLFNYLVQKDVMSEEHYKRMKDVEDFTEARNIPLELRESMRRHFEFQFRKRVENKASALIKLPISLEIKVASAQYKSNLDKCNIRGGVFFGCNDQFLNAVIIKLQEKYLMPSEFFVIKGDMSRELCFVLGGAVQAVEASSEGEVVLRTIRGNIPEVPSIVGEVAFFLGITNTDSIRARTDGDVKLLTLSKLDYDNLVTNYPEQHDKIVGNLLMQFSISRQGEEENVGFGGNDAIDDHRFLETKESIRIALKRRTFDDFSAMKFAAQKGDVEECAQILRRGLDINMKDYDGRTTLHVAAIKGMFKVVELLLESGADKNAVNRWGNAPLQVALMARQGPVAELLTAWKASLQVGDPTGTLCDAAGKGDLSMVQRLLDNGVNPNKGDFDNRTPFHLAAAEGQQKVVEYLLNSRADVNVRDRWGGTPLMDAIASRHPMASRMIFQAGGRMPSDAEADKLYDAAFDGDVPLLGLLADCDISLDVGDYDGRCALHLAATEANFLAVSFLLSRSANPNCTDRWGGTPLVDALRGEESYHIYCARLISSAGGRLGALEGTEEGQALYKRLDTVDICDVREKLSYLMKAGYHKKKPERMNLQQLLIHFEANCELINQGTLIASEIQNILDFFQVEGKELMNTSLEMAQILLLYGQKMEDLSSLKKSTSQGGKFEAALVSVNEHMWQNNCLKLSPSKLFQLFLKELSHNPDVDVELFFGIWSGDRSMGDDINGLKTSAVDDLYDDLDEAEGYATSVWTMDSVARQFQKYVMLFYRMEQSVIAIQEAFQAEGTDTKRDDMASIDSFEIEPVNSWLGLKDLPDVLKKLGLENVDHGELEAMIMESRTHFSSKPDNHLPLVGVTASGLIASSTTFHKLFLSQPPDGADETFRAVKKGLELAHQVWGLLLEAEKVANPASAGRAVKTVEQRTLKKLYGKLGEVGAELFENAFMKPMKFFAFKQAIKIQKANSGSNKDYDEEGLEDERRILEEEATLSFESFLNFWIEHITGQQEERSSVISSKFSNKKKYNKKTDDDKESLSKSSELVASMNRMVAAVKDRLHKHHSLQPLLFGFDVSQHYEQSFSRVVGSLEHPLKFRDLVLFLEVTFIEHSSKHGITLRNRDEFLKAFKLPRYESIAWSDIRKVVVSEKENKHKEEQRSLFLDGFVFNPASPSFQFWDLTVSASAAFVFFMVPFTIAFQPRGGLESLSWWFCSTIQDILFVLDLIFKFNLAYANKRSMMVLDRHKIARYYLASTFVVDLCAAFPFDGFAMLLGTTEGIRSWLRLPKLLRIRRVWLMIEARLGSTSTTAIFVRLLCLVGFVLHYFACIWYGLGQLDAKPNWFHDHQDVLCDENEMSDSARCDVLTDFGTRGNDPMMDKYLWTLYWTTTTLSGSGLVGGVLPTNFIEMTYTMILLFLHLTMVAYVVGIIGNMVMNADSKIVAMREEMLAVQSYISSKKLSPELQIEVKAHIYASQSGNAIDMGWLFSALSYNLQVKLAANLSLRFLGKVYLFKTCSDIFMDSLSVLLREETYSPEEYLFRCNEISREMYFVVSGFVENLNETVDGEVLESIMKPGDSCGDLSFFFGIRQIYTARVQAAGSATLFKLQKREFAELLKLYPGEEYIIARNALNVFDKTSANMEGGSQSQNQGGHSAQQSEAASTTKSNFDDVVGTKVTETIKLLKVRRKCDRMNLLFEAIRRRDYEDVEMRLNGGDISVNETNSNNRSPLHVACSEGVLDVVKLLLANGADPKLVDVFGNTPLNDAVRHKHDEVAAYLRTKCGVTLKIDINQAAVKLCEAAAAGNLEDLERLINRGVDVNAGNYDKRTPLHLAAAEGHEKAVQYLIEMGADVGVADRFGGIPLEDAIRHNHLGSQMLLVESGSKLENMSMACKMCEEAAEGKLNAIEVLVKCGVFANIANYDKRTALHLAASNDKNNVLYFLLKLEPPIDPNPVDRLGGTPLSDAIRHKNEVAQAQLKAAGGLEQGDPKLVSIQEAQKKEREDKEREVRIPKLRQMVDSSPENAKLKKVRDLHANLMDAVPQLCNDSRKMLNKLKQVCELLESETLQFANPGKRLAKNTSSNSRYDDLLAYDVTIESKSDVVSIQDIVDIRDLARSLAGNASSVLEHMQKSISEPRVKQLQPDWMQVIHMAKEEARLIFALSTILEYCHRYILKDVET